jgi:hypothetical protein
VQDRCGRVKQVLGKEHLSHPLCVLKDEKTSINVKPLASFCLSHPSSLNPSILSDDELGTEKDILLSSPLGITLCPLHFYREVA